MPTNSYCNTNHILIGLGGTGGKILRAFKMRMFEEFPDQKEREKQSVSLLYVDSSKLRLPMTSSCLSRVTMLLTFLTILTISHRLRAL